jgi:peptide/nickel transport system substrate-binding protein
MINRRQFSQVLGIGTLGTILANAPATVAQDGNTLRLATNVSDLQSLDAHFGVGTQDRIVVDMVHNGLIRFTPGTEDEFEPDLAEDMPAVEENDDGTQTWTFLLREGVIPHPINGTELPELTVSDILFSYEKAADPNRSAFSYDYVGWTFEADEASRTFRVTVPQPLSPLLFHPKVANLSGGFIIPQAAWEMLGADGLVTHPVGTGPFMYSRYSPQNRFELVAHKDFFRGEPQLDGVHVVYLPDPTSRELALQTGDIEVTDGVRERSWVDRIDASEGLSVDMFGVHESLNIHLSTQHEILQDIRVREAIVKGISRENHMEIAGSPISEVQYAVTSSNNVPGGLTEEEAEEAGVNYQFDPEGAITLLAEAGYPDGFELDLVASEMDVYRVNYEVLQEEMRQIGIVVNLEIVQHATMHELIREGRNAIIIYSVYRPNPDIFLTQFFTTDGGPTNFSGYTVDELRDQARFETDPDVQNDLWKQANIEILQNYAAYAPMYTNQVYARRSTVDYGHELKANVSYYPGITENTTMNGPAE